MNTDKTSRKSALRHVLRVVYDLLAPALAATVVVHASASGGEWFTAGVISSAMIFFAIQGSYMRELKRQTQDDARALAKKLRKRASYAGRSTGKNVSEGRLLAREAETYVQAATLVEELL